MKKQIFYGTATALITPFRDGEIDYEALGRIIDYQLSHGIEALVIGGTTGEAATLSDSERYRLFEYCRERVPREVKLIFGTGSNDTRAAIRHTREAERIGCDGVLIVTPYYNKGTVSGVTEHYLRLSSCTGLPIILYNVPSRTGVNLTLSQLDRLAKEENIVAIKEAGDSADRLIALRGYGNELMLYAGNDTQIYTTLALGGLGVISVMSNSHPRLCADICRLYRQGKREESLALQLKALKYIDCLFRETNPAPIKYAMYRLGLSQNELRLPLLPIGEGTKAEIDSLISSI